MASGLALAELRNLFDRLDSGLNVVLGVERPDAEPDRTTDGIGSEPFVDQRRAVQTCAAGDIVVDVDQRAHVTGIHTDMELHLVHKDASGRVAVVGVMIEESATNPAYEPVLAYMPPEEGDPLTVSGTAVNAAELLPAEQSYYRYDGSLTTPPCTEGVTWFVLATPVALSEAQIAAFQALYDHNYRPVQPINERTFLLTADLVPAALPGTGGTGGGPGPVSLVLLGFCLLAATRLSALVRPPRRGA